MSRDARDRILYRYTIELLIVDKADGKEISVSEDKDLLDAIRDVTRTVRNAIALATGAVNDVTRLLNEIENTVSGVLSVVGDVVGFVDTVSDFVNGVANTVARPFKEVADIVTSLDSAIERLFEAPFDAVDTVAASFRQMGDAFDKFAIHPDIFQSATSDKLAIQRANQELTTGTAPAALEAAEANPPKTLRALKKLGTAPLPGDRVKATGESGVARAEPAFSSADEHVLGRGDTLQSLAARFLGDARRWRQIAVLNSLEPPFISDAGLPGTLRTGDKILVPSVSRSPSVLALGASLGALPDVPLEERLLCRDFLLEPVAGRPGAPLFDLVVDVAGGSIDAKTVAGIPNLAQAIRTRVTVEQGTDVLYRRLGYKRLVGIGLPQVDADLAEFRLGEAVGADARIESVRASRILTTTLDVIEVEIDAAVRGFHEPITVRTRVM
jgi:hypothetical protein